MTSSPGWTVCPAISVEDRLRTLPPSVLAPMISTGEPSEWKTTIVRAARFPPDSPGECRFISLYLVAKQVRQVGQGYAAFHCLLNTPAS